MIVRREDGFEKRYLYRCQRCDVVVGYGLDEEQWSGTSDVPAVMFILSNGLMSTDFMASSRKLSEDQITIGASQQSIAAFE